MTITTTRARAQTPSAQAFNTKDGPLVAIAGVCGGAGASTLAWILAVAAAQASRAPVLVGDLGSTTPGLAAYSRQNQTLSLADLAARLARHQPVTQTFTVGPHGVRVTAGTRVAGPESLEELAGVLADARAAHGLCVVDCGTLATPAQRAAAAAATHLLRVLPADEPGVRRASAVLSQTGSHDAAEIVVARHPGGDHRATTRTLTRLAATRGAPLLLVPELPDPLDGSLRRAVELAQVALDGIGHLLRRP